MRGRTALMMSACLLFTAPVIGQEPNRDRPGMSDNATAKPYLGITVANPVTRGDKKAARLEVRKVEPNSPAAKAGFKTGDVIERAANRPVKNYGDLLELLAGQRPGDTVNFVVKRGGEKLELSADLGRQSTSARHALRSAPADERTNPGQAYIGVQAVPAAEFSDPMRERMGIGNAEGLVVMSVVPRGPAAQAGLRHGDVITAVGPTKTTDVETLRQAVRKAGAGGEVTLKIRRDGADKEIAVKPSEAPVDGFLLDKDPSAMFEDGLPLIESNLHRRVEQLEHRIQELEKRVREMGRKSGHTDQEK